MTGLRNQRGVALLAVIFFLVVMAFVGVIFISLSSTNTTQSVNEVYSSQAFYVAEGGLERAGRYLLKREGTPPCTTCTCTSINGNASFTNTTLGNGQFIVTSVFNTTMAPTTLSALTNATDSTIPVASVGGYAPFGRIMIDKEMMDYTASGTTASSCSPYAAPCFVGVIRGADGTAVTSHVSGTRVAQTQCLLTSTGGDPTIGAGTNQRVVSQADVVQDGWAVGQPGGPLNQHPLTLHWDGSSWTVQNNAALNIIRELQSVYCLSPSDCWAVGRPGGSASQRPLTLHWNGSSWTLQDNTLLNINQRLNSVYCLIANDCWAVGRNNGGKPLVVRWGVPIANRWNNYAGSTPNGGGANLNSVYMISSTDGWAVGDDSGVTPGQPIMFRWNSPTPGVWNDRTPFAPPGGGANLNSVFMVSSTDGWAVGDDPGTGQPIMFRWNGTSWIDWSPSPNIGANLMSVSMVSSTDGWVVSDAGDMLHWDGVGWTVDTQGTTASGGNRLNSVMIIGSKRPNIAWREVPQ